MLALFAGTWGSFALAYQLPIRGIGKGLLIGLWAASWLAVVIAVTRGHALEVLGPVAAIVIALLNWWRTIRPSNDRRWADDLSRMLGSTVAGSVVTLDNVRNFERSEEHTSELHSLMRISYALFTLKKK